MKTIVIIGGSKGIGKALLKSMLKQHNVINISRTEPDFVHQNLTHYSCDVLHDELPELNAVDKLIYCPGSINLKPISRLSLKEFRDDFEINVLGAVRSIKKYEEQIKKGNDPSVVLFSTVATSIGMPFHSSIAASKSGIEGLVKSLAAEWAPTVRINAIAPTITNTGLASRLLRNDRMKINIEERHPLKKILEPEEVADMAEFLISEKANSITGQVFKLDNGIASIKI
jgi:NAD(P)-dependent dehydrogenase (short-subunit alcohol dehydrogenase family)